jgi:hypothetical protein
MSHQHPHHLVVMMIGRATARDGTTPLVVSLSFRREEADENKNVLEMTANATKSNNNSK